MIARKFSSHGVCRCLAEIGSLIVGDLVLIGRRIGVCTEEKTFKVAHFLQQTSFA